MPSNFLNKAESIALNGIIKKQSAACNVTAIKQKSFHYTMDFSLRMHQEGIQNYQSLKALLETDFISKLPVYEGLSNLFQDSNIKVPLITHMIYVFKEGAAKKLSSNNIHKIIRTTERLNEDAYSWKHYFWTNNETNISDEIKSVSNLQVKNVNELNTHPLYPIFIQMLTDANNNGNAVPFLTQASDIFRLIVLQKFGGIYHDCDYEIFKPNHIYNLMKSFPLILTQESEGQDDVANFFIAVSPNHAVTNYALNLISRNFLSESPDYIYRATDKINKLVFETGPCVLTAAFFKYVQEIIEQGEPYDFMLFIAGGLTNHMLARSVQPFHSNPECQNPNIKSAEQFINYNDINITTAGADLLCGDWGASPDFARQLTYYLTEDIDAGLECGTWNELPRHLKATDYTLSISSLHGNEVLSCGTTKFTEYYQ